jgi:hypothetical protein
LIVRFESIDPCVACLESFEWLRREFEEPPHLAREDTSTSCALQFIDEICTANSLELSFIEKSPHRCRFSESKRV